MRAVHTPLEKLVEELVNRNHGARRPVFDRTGLTGFYDFEIEWARNDLVGSGPDSPDVAGPSVFTALQQRLGPKLEPGTAPLETVVIDHPEKPSEN